MQSLERAAKFRVVFVGETIEDVYRYGHLLARPLKEPIIAVQALREETYLGGIEAAARIAENFCDSALVISDRTVRKIRYIEEKHQRKLFEVYEGGSTIFGIATGQRSPKDLCAVIDYGHGMMTPKRIEWVRDLSPFLAVNVQVNAGNYGFNLASRYENADYLCIDEIEARLATQNRYGPIEDSLVDLSMLAPCVVITLGSDGSIGWSNEIGMSRCAAMTDRVVDTMGAGDAFFAVSAIAAAAGADLEEMMRLGNAAGAAKAQIVGHSRAVNIHDIKAVLND